MLATLWTTIIADPILNLLVWFYDVSGNLGLSIIALTVAIRLILVPIMNPSMKSMKKQRDLQPEITKLREKYKYDQKKLAAEQMALFKQHGINPASGCLSQIVMIMLLIALFSNIQAFTVHFDIDKVNSKLYTESIKLAPGESINTNFGYMDLSKPDPLYILALLSGVFQYIASKMMIPYIKKAEKVAEQTPAKSDDIAFQMQQQSLYMMPIMNIIIGVTLPAGVVLYIIVTTLFTVVQNYFVSGWGGMQPAIDFLAKKLNFTNSAGSNKK